MKKLLVLMTIFLTILFANEAKLKNSNFEQELLNSSKDNYTIYLASSKSEEKTQEFINKHNIKENSVAFKFGVEDPWYKVFYGVYDSKDKAIEVLDSLDDDLRKNNPLLQRVEKVQNSYKKYYENIDVKKIEEEKLDSDIDSFTYKLITAKSGYSLALASTPSLDKAKTFIQKYNLQGDSAPLKSSYGNEWYKIYYGVFDTKDKALDTLESLESNLKKNQPRLRKVGSIQKIYSKFYDSNKLKIDKELIEVNNVEASISEITSTLPKHSIRVIKNEEEGKTEFLLPQATKAIKEAYIASSETKYIVLCGDSFRIEAQNSLLKVLEEPPKNIIFLIITSSKNAILPTILSRVQTKYLKTKKEFNESNLNLKNLELREVYTFLKENQRISKAEAKEVVESILYTINKQQIQLNQKELHSFSTAMKLLELNSRPINVLTTLLLNIMTKR
jgi:DNA polymerase-3 subunit delta'